MNKLDKDYQALLADILENGVIKGDRTGTGTKSVFGRTIRHKMSDGFPLLTTKKMFHKGVFTELLWLLNGDTNIQWLVQNDCNIWVGDAYKKFVKFISNEWNGGNLDKMVEAGYIIETMVLQEESGMDFDSVNYAPLSEKGFTERIRVEDDFAEKWGDLGPIYGKQWRDWGDSTNYIKLRDGDEHKLHTKGVDQISKLLDDLTNNPDSRRMMVNAWKVDEINQMTLPPCHYGFQVTTRELSLEERVAIWDESHLKNVKPENSMDNLDLDGDGIPKRAISLLWIQRSVDTFLGLPFNIASYGALLMILGELTNMVPDELVGQLGDTHLYSNHFNQAEEQIGSELDVFERYNLVVEAGKMTDGMAANFDAAFEALEKSDPKVASTTLFDSWHGIFDEFDVIRHTRKPYDLPKLRINTEFWNPENVLGTNWDAILEGIEIDDFQLEGYESHSRIKAPLSN